MEKKAGGGIEVHDQTICCNSLCTGVKRKHLTGASIWERMPGNYRLFSSWTAADSVRSGCGGVLVRSLYFRLLCLGEWMTGCMRRIIRIRLLATLFYRLDSTK